MINTDNTFAAFLKAKAESGFGVKSLFQYRSMQMIHAAKQFWNKLVNPGHFQNLATVSVEGEFYHKCCTVQACYKKCMKKRSPENFKALQTAYEDVLAFASGDSQQHDHINLILDNHFVSGKSVGTAILHHKAYKELVAQGGSKISGRDFLSRIQKAYEAGYRGKVEEREQRSLPPGRFLRPDVQQVLSAPFAGLFLPYARVYKRHAEKNGGTLAPLRAEEDIDQADKRIGEQPSLSGQVVYLLKEVSKGAL